LGADFAAAYAAGRVLTIEAAFAEAHAWTQRQRVAQA
jgi:hypothetical protein